MPLNTFIKELTVYAGNSENAEILTNGSEDIMGTCKIEQINILPFKDKGVEVQGYTDIRVVGI